MANDKSTGRARAASSHTSQRAPALRPSRKTPKKAAETPLPPYDPLNDGVRVRLLEITPDETQPDPFTEGFQGLDSAGRVRQVHMKTRAGLHLVGQTREAVEAQWGVTNGVAAFVRMMRGINSALLDAPEGEEGTEPPSKDYEAADRAVNEALNQFAGNRGFRAALANFMLNWWAGAETDLGGHSLLSLLTDNGGRGKAQEVFGVRAPVDGDKLRKMEDGFPRSRRRDRLAELKGELSDIDTKHYYFGQLLNIGHELVMDAGENGDRADIAVERLGVFYEVLLQKLAEIQADMNRLWENTKEAA